jgi:hypothetical protein
LHKRHLVTTLDRARTDHLWIFDRLSGNWLEYRGPHGRTAEKPDAYVVLEPGETRTMRGIDVTSNYVLPTAPSELVAKVMFESSWRPGVRDARVESRCVPFTVRTP